MMPEQAVSRNSASPVFASARSTIVSSGRGQSPPVLRAPTTSPSIQTVDSEPVSHSRSTRSPAQLSGTVDSMRNQNVSQERPSSVPTEAGWYSRPAASAAVRYPTAPLASRTSGARVSGYTSSRIRSAVYRSRARVYPGWWMARATTKGSYGAPAGHRNRLNSILAGDKIDTHGMDSIPTFCPAHVRSGTDERGGAEVSDPVERSSLDAIMGSACPEGGPSTRKELR